MRDAVSNKELWKGRYTPTQYPSSTNDSHDVPLLALDVVLDALDTHCGVGGLPRTLHRGEHPVVREAPCAKTET